MQGKIVSVSEPNVEPIFTDEQKLRGISIVEAPVEELWGQRVSIEKLKPQGVYVNKISGSK